MLSIFRWFLVSVAVVMLTACGGGGSSDSIVTDQEIEIDNPTATNTEQGDETVNPTDTNNETYIDNNGDIVPVLSEKPDVLSNIDVNKYDEVSITILRNIDLNSGLAKSELSKFVAENEIIDLYVNAAVGIDVKCEDYGFIQGDLSNSLTLQNDIQYKTYSKKEYIDNTDYYTISCAESDFESVPSDSGLSGKYTIIQSRIYHLLD